jgi:hypothetical protein
MLDRIAFGKNVVETSMLGGFWVDAGKMLGNRTVVAG